MTKILATIPGLAVGMLVGAFSGLLGIGGGVIVVPALLYFWRLDMQGAAGTSLAVMIPTAIFGTLRHHTYGNVEWPLVATLALGTAVGTWYLGAPLCEALPSDTVKRIFGVVLLLLSLHMLGFFHWIGDAAGCVLPLRG